MIGTEFLDGEPEALALGNNYSKSTIRFPRRWTAIYNRKVPRNLPAPTGIMIAIGAGKFDKNGKVLSLKEKTESHEPLSTDFGNRNTYT